jgi:hypothetical protein
MRYPVDAYGLLLTRLGGQRWVDRSPAGLSATLRWLDTVLSDIARPRKSTMGKSLGFGSDNVYSWGN